MASTISCLTYKHHFTNIIVPTHAHCHSTNHFLSIRTWLARTDVSMNIATTKQVKLSTFNVYHRHRSSWQWSRHVASPS